MSYENMMKKIIARIPGKYRGQSGKILFYRVRVGMNAIEIADKTGIDYHYIVNVFQAFDEVKKTFRPEDFN